MLKCTTDDWFEQFPPHRQQELRQHIQRAAQLGAHTAAQLATVVSMFYRQQAASGLTPPAERSFARSMVLLLRRERPLAIAAIATLIPELGIESRSRRVRADAA